MEWLVSMPKVELHAHLNGSIRDSTLLELTKALGEKGVINFSQVEHIIMKYGSNCLAFENLSERLILPFQHEEKLFENIRSKVSKTGESNEGIVVDLLSIMRGFGRYEQEISSYMFDGWEGASIHLALEHALASHRRLRGGSWSRLAAVLNRRKTFRGGFMKRRKIGRGKTDSGGFSQPLE
ncbi:Adenosine deaminase-like protein [Arachis hypogaea]|nr:Adenosine deaminase-like protein [Arachis hypogaea]